VRNQPARPRLSQGGSRPPHAQGAAVTETTTSSAAPRPPPFPPLDGVAHRFVGARGVRFHVAEAGAGPPVLLLHGSPSTGRPRPGAGAAHRYTVALEVPGLGPWATGPGPRRHGSAPPVRAAGHRAGPGGRHRSPRLTVPTPDPGRRRRVRPGRPGRPGSPRAVSPGDRQPHATSALVHSSHDQTYRRPTTVSERMEQG
jgi:hypothetical protein